MTIRVGSHAEQLATKGKQAVETIRLQLLDTPNSFRLGKGLTTETTTVTTKRPLKPLVRRID